MVDEEARERATAEHFIRWLTRANPVSIQRLDIQRQTLAARKWPDFEVRDAEGQLYVLELTRLLPPEIRELERFLTTNVSSVVQSKYPRVSDEAYSLEVHFELLPQGRVSKTMAHQLVGKISEIVSAKPNMTNWELSPGFTLRHVADAKGGIRPWISMMPLPAIPPHNDPHVRLLRRTFEDVIVESDAKFDGLARERVLLMNIEQSCLDTEDACSHFKDGQGILLTWAEECLPQSSNIDAVYVEPGTQVWQGWDHHRVLAGHKYIGEPSGRYEMIWQRRIDSDPR